MCKSHTRKRDFPTIIDFFKSLSVRCLRPVFPVPCPPFFTPCHPDRLQDTMLSIPDTGPLLCSCVLFRLRRKSLVFGGNWDILTTNQHEYTLNCNRGFHGYLWHRFRGLAWIELTTNYTNYTKSSDTDSSFVKATEDR